MKVSEQFDRAMQEGAINNERGHSYGHPAENFGRAEQLFDIVRECREPQLRHALSMICVKLARLINDPCHVDSWVDIAGYARTACMVIDYKYPEAKTTEERHTVSLPRTSTGD